jgi:hypothetical protein
MPLCKLLRIVISTADGPHNISKNGRCAWAALCAHPIHTDIETEAFHLPLLCLHNPVNVSMSQFGQVDASRVKTLFCACNSGS